MFRLVIITIILTVLGATAYIAVSQPEILPSQLRPLAPKLSEAAHTGIEQAQTLFSKGKEAQPAVMGVKTEASKVFQEDSSGKPVHQKAIEFAQYEYCKMVVKSYETEQEKLEASPTPDADD